MTTLYALALLVYCTLLGTITLGVQHGAHGDAATSVGVGYTAVGSGHSMDFVYLSWRADPGTVTPPAGWTAGTIHSSGALDLSFGQAFYKQDVATTTYTWSWVNSTDYSFTSTQGLTDQFGFVLDQSGNNTGNDSAPTAPSETTTQNVEISFIGIAQHAAASLGALTFSAPTDSYNIDQQVENNNLNDRTASAVLSRILSATGTHAPAVTSTVSDDWVTDQWTFYELTATAKQSADASTVSSGSDLSVTTSSKDVASMVDSFAMIGLIGTDAIVLSETYFVLLVITSSDSFTFAEFGSVPNVNVQQYDSFSFNEYITNSQATISSFDSFYSVEIQGNPPQSGQSSDSFLGSESGVVTAAISKIDSILFTEAGPLGTGYASATDAGLLTEFWYSSVSLPNFDQFVFRERQKADGQNPKNETITLRETQSIQILTDAKVIPLIGIVTTKISLIGVVEP